MSGLITQIILYIYPLWALVAFIMGLVKFVDYFLIDHYRRSFLWAVIFLGWGLAFFGAGLLIAQVGDRAGIIPTIEVIWIVIFPIFAATVGIECIQRWQVLRLIEAAHQRRKNGN